MAKRGTRANVENRQQEILSSVKTKEITEYSQLQEMLKNIGVYVGLSTISRDVKELGLVKGPSGVLTLSETEAEQLEQEVQHLIKTQAPKVLLRNDVCYVRVRDGYSIAMAQAIDRLGWPEVWGAYAHGNIVVIIGQGDGFQNILKRLGL